MADVERTTFKQRMQMAGVIAGTVFTANTLFWIASHFYFNDKPIEAADAGAVRFAFATLSFIVAGMAYGAALAPRAIGHGIAALMGIASLVGGIAALAKGLPPVMGMTMLVVGGVLPWLTWLSLQRSRTGWAFLIAVVSVFGAVCFFGAPKVRHLLGIGLWHALIIPGLQIVCVIALSMLRGEYKD
jgi:hypothetical protein